MRVLHRAITATRTCEGRSAPGENTSESSQARGETTTVRTRRKYGAAVFRASAGTGTRSEAEQNRRPGGSHSVGRVV